ncbi:MAG: 4-hydroxythreonine-4-phosphate dehydrogenase [Paracoccaceae bacterium]|jgi:4-hydroxythreonine-4-phosphate dehydrogenase
MTPRPGAPLALSCGDPAGVGAEIAAAAWAALGAEAPFAMIGDADWAAGFGAPVVRIDALADATHAAAHGLPVLHRPYPAPPVPGVPIAANAAAVIASIEECVALARSGEAGGVVTLPINKKSLKDGAGFAHPGHTEFLAALDDAPRSVMMLMGPAMRVVPVTIHQALADVPRLLTADLVIETARIVHAAMRRDFGMARPRIAVAGLNPHAGEGGLMGREEIDVIFPAVMQLRAEGMDIAGPLPADTMFHPPARAKWDVALCMYHDQALIPIKTLDFDRGVNATLGLSFVRTSPDHGTAYDIAGKGVASPLSLIEAIRAASAMAAARATYDRGAA